MILDNLLSLKASLHCSYVIRMAKFSHTRVRYEIIAYPKRKNKTKKLFSLVFCYLIACEASFLVESTVRRSRFIYLLL